MTELEQLKAENARLAADCKAIRMQNYVALHDLLAPTIELLTICESLARASKSGDLALECNKQLARLRALTERKE